MTTMSLRLSAGTRDCSTYARNVFPLIEPSITHGAVIPFRRRPATAANQSLAAPAPAAQPDHFRIGRGLVDEHQSGGIKHGLPSLPASTCPGHVRAILLRGAQAFFLKLMLWRLKKLHTAVRLPVIPCLCITETTSSSVKSGCSSISVSSQGACASNGDVLPPRGLAAQLPVS